MPNRIPTSPPPGMVPYSPTVENGASSTTDASSPISAELAPLLRERPAVRNREEANRRWSEFPVAIRSSNQALDLFEGLESAHSLPENDPHHIDTETLRHLGNHLQERASYLPSSVPNLDAMSAEQREQEEAHAHYLSAIDPTTQPQELRRIAELARDPDTLVAVAQHAQTSLEVLEYLQTSRSAEVRREASRNLVSRQT